LKQHSGYDTATVFDYDIAVIGAGVFGAWTAFHLARAGKSVLLVDQHGAGNARSSSGGETRIMRMSYGADEIYTRSALRSLELWREFFPTMFYGTGVLMAGSPRDAYILNTRDTLDRIGIPFEWLERDQLRKRFPQIRFDRAAVGVYEPVSGVLMARRAVQAVVDAAIRLGAHFEIRRIEKPDRKLARTFVFACGPWLPKLFPKAIGARIRPTRQEVFFFGTPPGDLRWSKMPAWVAFCEGAYTIPSLDGRGFKLAIDDHGPRFDPETGDRTISRAAIVRARAVLRKRFPDLADAPLVETRVCQYENTSNGDFLIDRHPDLNDVWLVGGGSGHGFKHGPFVGEYVAATILGGIEPEPRFALTAKSARGGRSVF
jgi:sarcosine oxidase